MKGQESWGPASRSPTPGSSPAPPGGALPPDPGRAAPGPERPASSAFRRPSFRGSGGTLFGIHVINVLLTIITLGIYYFWAKTRVRRYLTSQTEIEGDRFAYHGTPRELLFGALKALLVFGLPILVLNMLRDVLDVPSPVKVAAGLASTGLFFLFYPVAIVGSRRYRLGRISWRGIHFSFRGRTLELFMLFLRGGILAALTLGLYYPFFVVRRQTFLVSNSYFGGDRFDFTGRGRDLFWPFLVALLLTFPPWVSAGSGMSRASGDTSGTTLASATRASRARSRADRYSGSGRSI